MPKDVEFNIRFLEPQYNVDKLLSIHEADIGYIDNSIGIHNMTALYDTVTLHIYSPPF
jgi:hypothetical protein